jgi:hypothetical protein
VVVILFKKIVNTLLALLLLVATTGVTLNKHYCMGRLKSVAVFHSAENCSGDGMTDPMPCCEDVSEQLKVDDLTKASFDFKVASELFQLAAISYLQIDQKNSSIEQDKPKFQDYSPPPFDQDIPILIQSFLI